MGKFSDQEQVKPPTGVRLWRRCFSTLILVVIICTTSFKIYKSCILGNIVVDVAVFDHAKAALDTSSSPYGNFPIPGDPFRFIPCTSRSLPPALDDFDPGTSWAKLFDPDPSHWSWGRSKANKTEETALNSDPYAGKGIFLCGYLDVPLDYTNKTKDGRIVRLAVTRFQVSGLSRTGSCSSRIQKSERTIVIEPGGPGGSGTSYAWRAAEDITERLSEGQFDVLGWDPRGVNTSLPAVSCSPHNVERDRWSLVLSQAREVLPSPKAHLEFVDAFYESSFRACWERQGDLSRFVSTAFVARDMEEIRKTLGEDELTGYLVSYGTGIGQTYANMFPNSVGRMILDGTEYVRDHRLVGGFGWTALDNGTDAWRDGFLGECIKAGPNHCALAKLRQGEAGAFAGLEARLNNLLQGLIERPIPGYHHESGPSLVTYSRLVDALYQAMYNAFTWPALAQMLYELDSGNSTLAAAFLDEWEYDPTLPCPVSQKRLPFSEIDLALMVICSDSFDAPFPEGGIDWWDNLWGNMTQKSWIAGNSRFYDVFPCRHFADFWPKPAEVYRGDLNKTLKHPVLLIAETYDPATPLRNGRRLLNEMGQNARLIAHHGYGHSSRDKSNCTDQIARNFILHGSLPEEAETACYANEKPYLYSAKTQSHVSKVFEMDRDPVADWREHMAEMKLWR